MPVIQALRRGLSGVLRGARQASDTPKPEADPMNAGNSFGGQEALTVSEDVFVSSKRVFLDGNVDFSGALVERFASCHCQGCGGCKVGGDALIRAAAVIARISSGLSGGVQARGEPPTAQRIMIGRQAVLDEKNEQMLIII